jgi:two-component system cell cycle response regulator DivK
VAPARILLVEDHGLNVELIRDLLAGARWAVLHVTAAEEALLAVRNERPDLLLMDIALPGMDGLEATRILKSSPATRDLCIVILTARAMQGDEERARAAGCDAYLTKPIDTRTFAGTLERLLRPRRRPGSAER